MIPACIGQKMEISAQQQKELQPIVKAPKPIYTALDRYMLCVRDTRSPYKNIKIALYCKISIS
jgi:hypothetical protein